MNYVQQLFSKYLKKKHNVTKLVSHKLYMKTQNVQRIDITNVLHTLHFLLLFHPALSWTMKSCLTAVTVHMTEKKLPFNLILCKFNILIFTYFSAAEITSTSLLVDTQLHSLMTTSETNFSYSCPEHCMLRTQPKKTHKLKLHK